MAKPASPSQQAEALVRARGVIQSPIGYTHFPWDLHPIDKRKRVPPGGPYDQAWQGVQRVNLMSRMGFRRASQYGPMPMPLQRNVLRRATVNQNNWSAFSFGAGPVNAQSQNQATADWFQQNAETASPGPVTMFLRRLRGG
jgi:hypothetical protein